MEEILKVKHLNKKYHTLEKEIEAIHDIDFSVNEGDFISIVGPSGCGKSTILSILMGLYPKSSGEIKIKNNKTIACMLQEDCLLPFRTILDNCLIGLEITGKLNKESRQYVLDLLYQYGLREFIHQYPASLSGGMRQRCALIRTLALRPDILLLDEATSALDYQSALAISEDIYHIIRKEGKTAIMVTHDISQAISMSDKVIVLSKRPAYIKNIYTIPFSKDKSPIEKRKLEDFSKYFEMIWRDLDVHL